MSAHQLFGIRRAADDLWFGGFGPAPDYTVRWFPGEFAYTYRERVDAEMQAYLLTRFPKPKEGL